MNKEKDLKDLGYNSFFERGRNELDLLQYAVARVISEQKGLYVVKNLDGEYFARITGRQMYNSLVREDYPAVGDWVAISQVDEKWATIQSILPRLTVLERRYGDKNRSDEKDKTQIIATNIDVALIVESVGRDYNLNRFERYQTLAENCGVRPVFVLNKVDLISETELQEKMAELAERFPDTSVITTSTLNEGGIDQLKEYLQKGETCCFLGSSGVGKSSIINILIGAEMAETGEISSYTDRGKHVTTARQMYFLDDGGIVIDNPGIREVGLTDAAEGIKSVFEEIESLASSCRFADCSHTQEKGCRIIEALNNGEISKERYSHYLSLKKEAEYFEMNDYEKRTKDRRFGKLVKQVKKGSNKY